MLDAYQVAGIEIGGAKIPKCTKMFLEMCFCAIVKGKVKNFQKMEKIRVPEPPRPHCFLCTQSPQDPLNLPLFPKGNERC